MSAIPPLVPPPWANLPVGIEVHESWHVPIGDMYSTPRGIFAHPFTLVLAGLRSETPAEGANRIARRVLQSAGLDYDEVMG